MKVIQVLVLVLSAAAVGEGVALAVLVGGVREHVEARDERGRQEADMRAMALLEAIRRTANVCKPGVNI